MDEEEDEDEVPLETPGRLDLPPADPGWLPTVEEEDSEEELPREVTVEELPTVLLGLPLEDSEVLPREEEEEEDGGRERERRQHPLVSFFLFSVSSRSPYPFPFPTPCPPPSFPLARPTRRSTPPSTTYVFALARTLPLCLLSYLLSLSLGYSSSCFFSVPFTSSRSSPRTHST